ncbi:MAG: iron-sulfur cluster assembly protein [Anaerolineales bacterium]|jgi:metal-sulfur cluster biosynthetic enzyme|nr:iron-sulfur cluster assembly protein [Anaerolineales bacterium]MDP7643296.1 iron-sulfur cluster assembly protein [Anaerolineales bacterium]HJL69880.1 iron-sulfur cluster assembly protein [Anaerolineales bacterium]HJN42354.1 iron-sulfur cluster assembly protein [Anaerolineales bacterium]|tara:strand:- start:136 stop:462 length:327 start_codon:yes stop_codon:yes gene_type:complete
MPDTPAANTAENPEANAIRDALREVMDPELGMSVVELGLIRDIEINAESATVFMILTTPFCPYGPALLESVRTTAEKAASVPTEVEMGTEMWTPEMMEDGAGGDWGLF